MRIEKYMIQHYTLLTELHNALEIGICPQGGDVNEFLR